MKSPLTVAEEKVLRLLAREGRALERSEICEALGWVKSRVHAVLLRLVQCEPPHVVVTPGTPDRAGPQGGRPPALYSLPGLEPVKPGEVAGPYFAPLTFVVTPAGREARVIGMRPGGFCEIEYLVVRLGHDPRAEIKARLLREYQPGRAKPEPVRVTLQGEVFGEQRMRELVGAVAATAEDKTE